MLLRYMNAIRPLNMQAIFSENGFIFSISVIVMTFFLQKNKDFVSQEKSHKTRENSSHTYISVIGWRSTFDS